MFCNNCRKEFEGNFCVNCGQRASGEVLSSHKYVDKFGYAIDLPTIYGVYKTESEMKRFFKRWTTYDPAQIDDIIRYVLSFVVPIECGGLKALQARHQIESSNKELAAAEDSRTPTSKVLNEQTRIQRMQLNELKKANRLQRQQMNAQAKCPRCGSTSISGSKKGFGIGKAVIGAAVIANPLGLVVGNLGAKKVRCTCLKCGKQWKA